MEDLKTAQESIIDEWLISRDMQKPVIVRMEMDESWIISVNSYPNVPIIEIDKISAHNITSTRRVRVNLMLDFGSFLYRTYNCLDKNWEKTKKIMSLEEISNIISLNEHESCDIYVEKNKTESTYISAHDGLSGFLSSEQGEGNVFKSSNLLTNIHREGMFPEFSFFEEKDVTVKLGRSLVLYWQKKFYYYQTLRFYEGRI